ncbi:YjbE family integral membrane protein [Scopulibacillus darangshiensis]|uniref:YjbE family integral membrane protein n=1 Tax=Scopulibacillus darangshiensis TaxID=442528 RepID=A0A4R2P650_9BACL|nr:TerC family protein [Scopulibacillus darangshiensis]TCP29265.1 YjbE family integral membrane protein [Scopulibacillus darangshiensis]
MDIFTLEFWTTLLLIVGLDLILAGDNAIVIALAARRLPEKQQKKAILWGTIGAVAIRATATLIVVWLLKIPGLHLVGGILLIWIAYKLLIDNKGHDGIKAGTSLTEAIRTIVIADALMGLDNVLAIAGASHGSYFMVILGLIISIPMIMWGSTLFLKLVDRYSWIIYAGSAVLAFTAAKMLFSEPFMEDFFTGHAIWKWCIEGLIIIGVLFIGLRKNKKGNNTACENNDENSVGNESERQSS